MIKILALGGCLLHGPLNRYTKLQFNPLFTLGLKGYARETYSFGEMRQLVRFVRGEIQIPAGIKVLAGMDPWFEPRPGIGDFAEADAVLLEPNTAVEIIHGDYVLNRTAIVKHILEAIRIISPGPETARQTNFWMSRGLLGGNDVSQRELGRQLVSLIPETMPFADLVRDVLMNARSEQGDLALGLRDLRAMIDRPMGVMTYIFQYMPDGRPISWPSDFRDDVLAAATALNLPVFEPWRLVEQYGAEVVLKEDRRHWNETFMPTISQAIVDFAAEVAHGKASVASAVA